MKKILNCILITLLSYSCFTQEVFNQSYSSGNLDHFIISNMAGDVIVRPSQNDQLEVLGTLNGKKLNAEMSVEFKKEDNYLLVYIKTPCTKDKSEMSFDESSPFLISGWSNKDCNCNWNPKDGDIFTQINFVVSLPKDINLYASTINEGELRIENIQSKIHAQNVNGGITITNAKIVSHAKTVNGEIKIDYDGAPSTEGSFATINGDIKIKVRNEIDANATFKSFSGDFFTDFDTAQLQPSVVEKNSKNGNFKFKIDDRKVIKLNNGGFTLAFETFNGNAYLTTK